MQKFYGTKAMNPTMLAKRAMRSAYTLAFGRNFRLVDRAGREIKVRLLLPEAIPKRPSAFVFGIFKGGSTLLNRMVADILAETGREPFELPGRLFKMGIVVDQITEDKDGVFELDGMVYTGFRSIPPILQKSANFKRARKLVLVRDPRDILVSLYFSHAYSHEMPKAGEARKAWEERRNTALATDVDQYAIQQAGSVLTHLMRMGDLVGDPGVTLLRYEDIIFDKERLADIICETIGLDIPREARVAIAKKNDIRPAQENKLAHIRNVAPGDHLNKLKPETISQLSEVLSPALDLFYPECKAGAKRA